MRLSIVLIFALFSAASFSQTKFEGIKKINGANLFLTVKGRGEHLLVIHGGPGLNQSYFKPYLDALSSQYTLVYYDQRACGKSKIPSTDSLSLKFFIEDIEALRKELGADGLNILAHSWGSVLATQYAIQYPDRVKKIIYSNPAPLSKEFDLQMATTLKSRLTKQDSLDRAAVFASGNFGNENMLKLLKINFKASAFDKRNIDKINFDLQEGFGNANRALFTGLSGDLSSYNYYQQLEDLNFPVLIIHGKYDGIPFDSIEKLKSALQNASIIVMQKSGHFPFVEEPEEFAKAVATFLK